jgi:hypothetical protein
MEKRRPNNLNEGAVRVAVHLLRRYANCSARKMARLSDSSDIAEEMRTLALSVPEHRVRHQF